MVKYVFNRINVNTHPLLMIFVFNYNYWTDRKRLPSVNILNINHRTSLFVGLMQLTGDEIGWRKLTLKSFIILWDVLANTESVGSMNKRLIPNWSVYFFVARPAKNNTIVSGVDSPFASRYSVVSVNRIKRIVSRASPTTKFTYKANCLHTSLYYSSPFFFSTPAFQKLSLLFHELTSSMFSIASLDPMLNLVGK